MSLKGIGWWAGQVSLNKYTFKGLVSRVKKLAEWVIVLKAHSWAG